jgi:hypothetical protein
MTEATSEVTQTDRDVAADIWRDYVARIGEVIVERNMRAGGLDDGLPAILARHRCTTEARIEELAEAARAIEPYLDAIICYASTMDEHEPNRLAHNFRRALAALTNPEASKPLQEGGAS